MQKQKNREIFKKKLMRGFTLIELLIVIAIIGILSGIVLVSTQSAVVKAKKAAALSSVSSVLPELVTCNDDSGKAIAGVPSAGGFVCCTDDACGTAMDGHIVTWPDITKTGWNYLGASSGALETGDYRFTIKLVSDNSQVITCDMAGNSCN